MALLSHKKTVHKVKCYMHWCRLLTRSWQLSGTQHVLKDISNKMPLVRGIFLQEMQPEFLFAMTPFENVRTSDK